ncbi:MAG: nucleoside triphosphate pyrophosphatase [Sphingomonadales bacterium]
MTTGSGTDLVLASASPARARLLRGAGIDFRVQRVGVDEDAVKDAMLAEGAKPRDIADTLAEMKALRGSMPDPRALVIGADQVLVLDGVLYSKPVDRAAARDQLQTLRGKTHELVTAVAAARGGSVVWRHVETVRLTMRAFTDAFLDDYLARAGDGVLSSVGCYHLEGLGVHLMDRIDGDHFTVQGLPLLALLRFLRDHGVLAP